METITIYQADHTAHITLNRPNTHNAFNALMIEELTTTLRKIGSDRSVRVLVLSAAGKSFSAGADLNWMSEMAHFSEEENIQDAEKLASLFETLNELSIPTIAAVHGYTFGGGVGLVACCDIVVANNQSVFGLTEVKLGLSPAVISPYVIAAIGARAARQYFLTGESFSAETALQLGLVSKLTDEPPLDEALLIADQIQNNAPRALKATKQLIKNIDIHTPQQHKKMTTELIASLRCSAEGQEGMSAFLAKRPPNWNQQ